MNDLGNQYALHALKERRAALSGEIHTLERRTKNLRETLIHLDATLRLFAPDADPAEIVDKRVPKRVKPFVGGKMTRLILGVLRRCEKPMGSQEVVDAIVAELGYGASTEKALKAHVRSNLGYLARDRGLVKREGRRRGVKWTIAQS